MCRDPDQIDLIYSKFEFQMVSTLFYKLEVEINALTAASLFGHMMNE